MSLRARLFLLFGGLLVALLVAQGLLFRGLTCDLDLEIGEMAVSVGRDILSGAHARDGKSQLPAHEESLPTQAV